MTDATLDDVSFQGYRGTARADRDTTENGTLASDRLMRLKRVVRVPSQRTSGADRGSRSSRRAGLGDMATSKYASRIGWTAQPSAVSSGTGSVRARQRYEAAVARPPSRRTRVGAAAPSPALPRRFLLAWQERKVDRNCRPALPELRVQNDQRSLIARRVCADVVHVERDVASALIPVDAG